ncbi:hypothetical protein JB92DRAFT_2926413 [Gautieria morchelliformis]|nr:hypothetical protein JB92DRAFT_2926413 [Gautieria morchelliformis]
MGIEGDCLRQLPSIHSLGIPLSLAEVLAMPPLDDKHPITLPPLRYGPQPSSSASALRPRTIALSREPHSGAVRTKKRPKRGSGPYTLPTEQNSNPMSGSMLNSSSEPATSGTKDIVARRGAQPDRRERLVWRVEPGVGLPGPQGQAGQGDEWREEGSSRRMEPKKIHFHYHYFDEYGEMTQ